MIRPPLRDNLPTLLGFWLLLLIVLASFFPGLGGDFVFDDMANLQPWRDIGDIDTLEDVTAFVLSGTGFPGRPLSLLSFLMDDQSWMPDIGTLKRTGLAIHLLNACLVFWLSFRLLQLPRISINQTRAGVLALAITALWSLHPIQVSNVSYIIQRMNLLSTLLTLAALLIFVAGRSRLDEQPRLAFAALAFACGIVMPLAVLAKENGLLACVYILLIDRFCFTSNSTRDWKLAKALLLWLPLLMFLAYCLYTYDFFRMNYPYRTFDSWERLLTQGPVIATYLEKLLLPRFHGSGLYFDNFMVSRSLFQPISTMYCWLLLLLIIGFAWIVRKRLPLVSFGLLFYFSGHLMESTLIPLELYFEHRNYLPQLGLWIAVAGLLDHVRRPIAITFTAVATIALVLLLSLMTRAEAGLWSYPAQQAATWHNENPGSLRSTLSHADYLIKDGQIEQAMLVLGEGQRHHPNSLILEVSRRYIDCYLLDKPTVFSDLAVKALHSDHEYASIIMLEKMRASLQDRSHSFRHCQPASRKEIASIYKALLKNPRYRAAQTDSRLNEYLAEIAVDERNLNATIEYYDAAFASKANPIYPYRQAVLLESAGLITPALEYAAKARHALGLRQHLQIPELNDRLVELEKRLDSATKADQTNP